MQQFYFTFNCQELQSTRNCIIYNHLNLSWKYGDVNLKCMMRHIIFQNSFQRLCKKNGVETLKLAQFEVQGGPSWPGLWGCIYMEWRWASGSKHVPGKYMGGQHVKSPGSPSHSTFHSQHGLEGPTSLPEVFMLSFLEKRKQCHMVTISQKLWFLYGGSIGREAACQYRRHDRFRFDPWVGKIPWRRAWQPTPVFLPGESHGQRSPAG